MKYRVSFYFLTGRGAEKMFQELRDNKLKPFYGDNIRYYKYFIGGKVVWQEINKNLIANKDMVTWQKGSSLNVVMAGRQLGKSTWSMPTYNRVSVIVNKVDLNYVKLIWGKHIAEIKEVKLFGVF